MRDSSPPGRAISVELEDGSRRYLIPAQIYIILKGFFGHLQGKMPHVMWL